MNISSCQDQLREIALYRFCFRGARSDLVFNLQISHFGASRGEWVRRCHSVYAHICASVLRQVRIFDRMLLFFFSFTRASFAIHNSVITAEGKSL